MGQRPRAVGTWVFQKCSWGPWGSLGKDCQSPLILFCARMLVPAPPCFLHQPQQTPRPSGGALWPLLFAWAFLLPSLSLACLILTWRKAEIPLSSRRYI